MKPPESNRIHASWTAARPSARRIALIGCTPGLESLLDYAIESCRQMDAGLDLLIYQSCDAKARSLRAFISQAGIESRYLPLGRHPADEVLAYVADHPSLIFLLADPTDALAKALLEESVPRSGRRLLVPLVFVENQTNPDQKVDL